MNVTVTTGTYRSGSPYWLVRYRLPDGKLIRKFFPDSQSAEDHAECLGRESVDARSIPEALKFEAAECAEKLRSHNWTIRRATEYVLQNIIPYETKPLIRNAVVDYMEDQVARGLERHTLSEMRHRMRVFVAKFGDKRLHELKVEDYSLWMKSLASEGYEPRGITHFLSRASGFVNWAMAREYCVGNALDVLQWPKVKSTKPAAFRCPKVKALFEIAPRHGLLSWAVLGTLVGVRPCELRVLGRLCDVLNLDERHITVDHEDFAPSERRVIDLEGEWGKAVIAWLRHCKMNHPIVPWPERRHVEALRKELGCWPYDVMRHTGASAHYALFADVGKTMKMLGHAGDPQIFHNHYKALMTRAEAKAIYSLRPV